MPSIATIGVYGFDLGGFLAGLDGAGVGIVLDVRQRRGVLAPTTEMRRLQYREDDRRGEGKRSRTHLAPEYPRRYSEEILAPADLSPIVEIAADRLPALLCVERDAEACHRSLIAARLERHGGLKQIHPRPE